MEYKKKYEDGLFEGRLKLLLELVTKGTITEEFASYKMNVTLELSDNIEKLEKYLEQHYSSTIVPIGGRPKKLQMMFLKI